MINSQPLVSIAMCTYNGEQYLEQQLQSILGQSYKHLEIIIVDDCSTDKTYDLLKQFAAQDSRIKLHQNTKNIGFIRNFEYAISMCNGQYIALADQDDIWLPEKIKTLMDEIGDNLLIYSKVSLIDRDNQPIDEVFPRINRIDGNCALSLIVDNCVTGHACLIDRNLIQIALPLPKALFSHDQWFAINAAAKGKLKASTQILSLYRLHGGNTIAGTKKRHPKGKAAKNAEKLSRTIKLAESAVAADILSHQDRELLNQFRTLLKSNNSCLYNYRLSAFLKLHQDKFLQLYSNRKKSRQKLCRGVRYFKITDVLSNIRRMITA